MRDLPYFKWYPADAESDEDYATMTDEELGFYHRCLNKAWINRGLTSDSVRLSTLMGVTPATLKRLWKTVGRLFQVENGRYVNRRQEHERAKITSRNEQLAQAAVKSHAPGVRERARDELLKQGLNGQHKQVLGEGVAAPRAFLRADSDSDSESSSKILKPKELNGSPRGLEVWPAAGFEDGADFENWFSTVYRAHPTKGDLQVAKDQLRDFVIAGVLKREAFEQGYAAHKLSSAWTRERGRYVPKLSTLCRDQFWLYPPTEVEEERGEY